MFGLNRVGRKKFKRKIEDFKIIGTATNPIPYVANEELMELYGDEIREKTFKVVPGAFGDPAIDLDDPEGSSANNPLEERGRLITLSMSPFVIGQYIIISNSDWKF